MRNVRWLAAAVLVASTTGCVESVNQGYGYNSGYSGYGRIKYLYPQCNRYTTQCQLWNYCCFWW